MPKSEQNPTDPVADDTTPQHPEQHHARQSARRTRRGIMLGGGGLAALLAVKAIAGGHHEGAQYDADTEAQMQHAMRPAMVRLAKKAVKASSRANSSPNLSIARQVSPDGSTVDLNLHAYQQGGIESDVDVVMGVNPRTGKPDPNKVESVQTRVDWGGVGSQNQILAAPGAELDVPFPTDPTGWSAIERNGGIYANYLNSSVPEHTLAAVYHSDPDKINPVSTAHIVTYDARSQFAVGIRPFVGPHDPRS